MADIAPGDEVIYPANNPRSQFVVRVVSVEGTTASCVTLRRGDTFNVDVSMLRHVRTEGS